MSTHNEMSLKLGWKISYTKKKSLYFVNPCHQLVPCFRQMQEQVFDYTKTGLSLRAGTTGDSPPPPGYFHKKIEEKQNPQKSLAVWFPTYCCIYPAATWNLSDSPPKSKVMHCNKTVMDNCVVTLPKKAHTSGEGWTYSRTGASVLR